MENHIEIDNNNYNNSTKTNSTFTFRGWDFFDYCLLACLIFGTIGNSLSILIMNSKELRKTNAALFLICMAVSDNIFLVSKFLAQMIKMYHINVYNFCILSYIVIPQVASFTSIWLVIMITFERCVSVVWPFKLTQLLTKKRCKIAITCMILLFLALTTSTSFCIEYNQSRPYLCSIRNYGNCKFYFNNVYQILKSLLGSWLPSLFGLCLNIIFLFFLNRFSKRHRHITSRPQINEETTNTNKCVINKEKQLTIMILAISISFLILTIPYSIFELMRKTLDHDSFHKIIPANKVRYFQRATLLLVDFNHSTNFFFYVLTAERFRQQFNNLKPCKKDSNNLQVRYSQVNQAIDIVKLNTKRKG